LKRLGVYGKNQQLGRETPLTFVDLNDHDEGKCNQCLLTVKRVDFDVDFSFSLY
jgi:hypothetical protein